MPNANDTILKIILVILSLIFITFWRKLSRNPYSEKNLLNKLKPIEFSGKYATNPFYLPCTDLKLYGKGTSKVFDNWHRFEKSVWHEKNKTLEIHFLENVILNIVNPSDIEERRDRVIIWSAERISWEWKTGSVLITENDPYSFEIVNFNNKLELKDPRGLVSGDLKIAPKEKPAIELIG